MIQRRDDSFADLQTLAAIARDAELSEVADEAAALVDRLAAGRFFVACVGQFKRGKSSVPNALVNDAVLPVGVTSVTSAIPRVRVHLHTGHDAVSAESRRCVTTTP